MTHSEENFKNNHKVSAIYGKKMSVGVLATPHVSMFFLLAAIEPLRNVNRLVGGAVYSTEFVSVNGEAVIASNGLVIPADTSLMQKKVYDMIIVGISYRQSLATDNQVFKWLRFQASKGALIVGLDLGVMAMAGAGLLDGFKAAVLWEVLPAAREEFPDLEFTEDLYCIDRNRMTASGTAATLDMMLVFIHHQHGRELAIAVAHELTVTIVRNGNEPQRMGLYAEPWAAHGKLAKAIEVMKNNLESPLPIKDIAAEADISIMQLRRLSSKYLESSPSKFYLSLRLRKSRELVLYSKMHMTEIAQACGFSSSSTFARAFQTHFLISATEYRRRHQLNLSRPYIGPSAHDVISDGLFPFVDGAKLSQ